MIYVGVLIDAFLPTVNGRKSGGIIHDKIEISFFSINTGCAIMAVTMDG